MTAEISEDTIYYDNAKCIQPWIINTWPRVQRL